MEWDAKAQNVISKSQEGKDINNHLVTVKAKILQCQSKLESRNMEASVEAIKNEYIGKKEERKKLVEVFDFKLKRIQEEVGSKKTEQATYDKYEDTFNHLVNFLKSVYHITEKYLD